MNFKINDQLWRLWRLFLGILIGSSIGVFTGAIFINIMNPGGWWHLGEIPRIDIILYFFTEFWPRTFLGTTIVGVSTYLILNIQKRQPAWLYFLCGIPAGIIGDIVLDRGEQVWFPYPGWISKPIFGDGNSLISLAWFPVGLFFLTLCSIISLLAFWLIFVRFFGRKESPK